MLRGALLSRHLLRPGTTVVWRWCGGTRCCRGCVAGGVCRLPSVCDDAVEGVGRRPLRPSAQLGPHRRLGALRQGFSTPALATGK